MGAGAASEEWLFAGAPTTPDHNGRFGNTGLHTPTPLPRMLHRVRPTPLSSWHRAVGQSPGTHGIPAPRWRTGGPAGSAACPGLRAAQASGAVLANLTLTPSRPPCFSQWPQRDWSSPILLCPFSTHKPADPSSSETRSKFPVCVPLNHVLTLGPTPFPGLVSCHTRGATGSTCFVQREGHAGRGPRL